MNWLSQCREWVRKYDPVRPEHFEEGAGIEIHHYGFMRRLSEKLPANAIIVSDTGGNVIMMGHCFKSKAGQRLFSSNGSTSMGFAMCGAMGAWFAQPDRPIICVIGDGGMQLNIQELQTIVHYKIPIKIFIVNNKILGNTAIYQLQNGKKPLACGPDGYSSPDFIAVARAYGIFAAHIPSWIEADNVIDIVLGMDEAVICDVVHENFCDYQPRMQLWQGGIEEAFPPLPQDEFRANMLIDPMPGWEDRQKLYRPIK